MPESKHQIQDKPFFQKSASHAILPGGRHPNDIRALAITPNRIVWIGTTDGLSTCTDHSFTRVGEEATGCPDIKCLSVDPDGALLVGTELTLVEKNPSGTWSIHLDDTWDDSAITAATRTSDTIAIATLHQCLGKLKDRSVYPMPELYPSERWIFGIVCSRDKASILGEAGVTSAPPDLHSIHSHELKVHQVRDLVADNQVELQPSLDSETVATNEDDGTYYLLPYWMGRYYRFQSKGLS